MEKVKVTIPANILNEFCHRYHIRKLAYFGSVLREDFDPQSDVDILVEFEEGHTPGLSFIDIQDELSHLLGGRELDLVTPNFLNHRIENVSWEKHKWHMARNNDAIYIGHMLDMTRRADKALKWKSREDYVADDILRLGLTHLVQVIGEAARRVSPEFQEVNPEIRWRQIIGMRHRIVHDYMRVDEDVLWDVVTKDLRALLPILEKLAPEE